METGHLAELAALATLAGCLLALIAFMDRSQRDDTRNDDDAPHPPTRTHSARHAARPGAESPRHSQHRPRDIRGRASVIDGDTIIVNHVRIRLAGIDAPGLDHPWGHKAKRQMVDICRGRILTVRFTGERSCKRWVARCYLPDGTDIGAELVRRGLALDSAHFSSGAYRHLEPPGARRRLAGRGIDRH